MEFLRDFLDGGPKRTAARDKWVNDNVMPYIPPNLRGWFTVGDALNPVSDIRRAGEQARVVANPERSTAERIGAVGNVATDMASVLAPAAATRISKGMVGASTGDTTKDIVDALTMASMPADDAIQRFGRDQAGNVKIPLLAHHNISPEKLEFADNLGGMPYPSIAISRVDAPLENFGDISLIGGPEMAVPNRLNRVFPGDGYTIRQPRGELMLDGRSLEKGMKSDPRFGHLKDVGYWWDMFDNVDRADEALQSVETAIQRGLINPNDYDKFEDMRMAARQALPVGYAPSGEGIAQFAEVERVLPQGFSPSGNRRKPKPYTLENVMKEMRAEAKNAGAENFNYGASSFRANANKPFPTFSQVSRARDRILPEGETNEIFGSFSDQYMNTLQKIADSTGDSGFRSFDWAGEYANDYAAGRNLKDWRGVSWVDNMSPEMRAEIDGLVGDARNLPANYFEAKPQRAVGVGEFEGAILPESATDARQILERAGVREILTYGSPEQRRELFTKFPHLQFSMAGAGAGLGGAATLGGVLNGYDQDEEQRKMSDYLGI